MLSIVFSENLSSVLFGKTENRQAAIHSRFGNRIGVQSGNRVIQLQNRTLPSVRKKEEKIMHNGEDKTKKIH